MHKTDKAAARSARGMRLLAAAGGLALAAPTFAQTDMVTLEEIVVTATKREEPLQSVPVAVTALNAEGLEARSVSSLAELGKFTPGLTYQTSSGVAADSRSVVFIRGVGQAEPFVHNDPGVAMYVDGVYLGRTQGSVLSTTGVERVEVLRGPQGTLFGRNTSAGAINVIMRKPSTDAFEGKVKLEGGDYNQQNASLFLNVPMGENFAMSLDASSTQRDGYIDVRDYTTGEKVGEASDDDTQFGRVAFRWAGDKVDAQLAGDFTKRRAEPQGLRMKYWNDAAMGAAIGAPGMYDLPPLVAAYGGVGVSQLLANQGRYDTYATYNFDPRAGDFNPHDDQDNWGLGLTVTFKLSEQVKLKSITGHRDLEIDAANDNDGLPYHINSTLADVLEQDQTSQEFQLNWDAERHNFVGGVFYLTEDATDLITTNNFASDFGVLLGGAPWFTEYKTDSYDYSVETWAVYLNDQFHVTDALTLTAGVRYSEETKEMTYGNLDINGNPLFFNGYTPLGPVKKENTWDSTTGKFGVDYKINDNVLVYGSVSEGWKSGTFNTFAFSDVIADAVNSPPPPGAPVFVPNSIAAAAPAVLDPEEVLAYEVGLKSDLFEERLRLNVAAFYNDYTDQQLVTVLPGMVAGFGRPQPIVSFINVGDSKVQGLELEGLVQMTEAVSFDFGFSYTDTEIKSVNNPNLVVDNTNGKTLQAGMELPFTPEWLGHAGLSVASQVGSLGFLSARVDYSYHGEQWNYIGNTAEDRSASYSLVDLRVSFSPDALKNFEVFGTVKNLADEEYDAVTNAQGFPFTLAIAGAPRMWTLGAIYSF